MDNLTSKLEHGNKIIHWNTLNIVSAFATKRLSVPLIELIKLTIGSEAKIKIAPITTNPTTLNITWIKAVLFAFRFAFIAAITAGIHEPIFAPKIKYKHAR